MNGKTAPPPPKPEPEPEPEDAPPTEPEGIMNMAIFNQLIELDDRDTHNFSYSTATGFFSQAVSTFADMDKAL